MSRIHEIPIVATGAPAVYAGPSSGAVLAILNEIAAKLETLAAGGEDASIDLRPFIGSPRELALLRETLGRGEVSAAIKTVGQTLLQETAIPCVWWISHRDHDDSPLGEFIEIAEAPDLLRSDRLAIHRGLNELRARCARLAALDPLAFIPPNPESPS
jgi:hypothetical protein